MIYELQARFHQIKAEPGDTSSRNTKCVTCDDHHDLKVTIIVISELIDPDKMVNILYANMPCDHYPCVYSKIYFTVDKWRKLSSAIRLGMINNNLSVNLRDRSCYKRLVKSFDQSFDDFIDDYIAGKSRDW